MVAVKKEKEREKYYYFENWHPFNIVPKIVNEPNLDKFLPISNKFLDDHLII